MSTQDKSRYQIDDILEEAQRKKLDRLKQPQSPKPAGIQQKNFPISDIRPGSLRGKAMKEEPKAPDASKKIQTMPKPFIKPAEPVGTLFPAKPSPVTVQNTAPQKEMQKPVDDVKVYIPKSENTAIKDRNTIVINNKAVKKADISNNESDDLEQIQLSNPLDNNNSGMDTPVTPTENMQKNTDETDDDWEERLKYKRKEKAENFRIHESSAFKLSGEEEVNDPGEEPEVFEDEELEDYVDYEETEAVRSELIYRRRIGFLKLFLTGLLASALICLMVGLYILKLPILNPVLFIGLNVFLLGIIALLNHRSFGVGLSSLFHRNATADSAVGLAALLVLLHTLLQLLNLSELADGQAIVLAPVAALGLFFNALGKQMQLKRVCNNFQFVSYRGDKYAVKIVDDERVASEIGREAVDIGVPVVCYLEKTQFLSHFLEYSYKKDTGDRAMRRFIPFVFLGSVIVALIYGIFIHDIMNALTIFVSAICLSAPMGIATAVNFPLHRSAKRALRHGAMLTGSQTIEEFGEIHALAVDALDLFPSESVLLHGIKTFSGSRIDEAIMDAAAVSIAAGGPLSSVFRRVIQNRVGILPQVDTLVYEQDMGMSGWVGGRRVLIGNRRLLENHGVDVPSRDYETRYMKDDRQLVYLSTAGELSAMFVVSYVADESISDALSTMTRSNITLLVRTCDPNITEDLICREFDLDPYYVEVMETSAGRCYKKLTSKESEQNDAIMASNGRLEGAAYGVTYCRRLYRAVRTATAVQVIGGALGFALCAFLSLCTNILLPPLFFLGYVTMWTVLSWIVPSIYRV